jgi:hypothetical protein
MVALGLKLFTDHQLSNRVETVFVLIELVLTSLVLITRQ